jgi:hypothetical protein
MQTTAGDTELQPRRDRLGIANLQFDGHAFLDGEQRSGTATRKKSMTDDLGIGGGPIA